MDNCRICGLFTAFYLLESYEIGVLYWRQKATAFLIFVEDSTATCSNALFYICHFDSRTSLAVISTLFNFVKMFKQAHEENCKQLEFEKKKAEKEAEKTKMNASDTGHLLHSQVKGVN